MAERNSVLYICAHDAISRALVPRRIRAHHGELCFVSAPFWFLPPDDTSAPARRLVLMAHERAHEHAHEYAHVHARTDTLPSSPDDATAIADIRAGNAAAFERLFHTMYGDLHRYATSLTRNAAVAEELVADTFVHLWAHRHDWDVRASIRAHLFTAVRHRVLHWHRRARLEHRHATEMLTELAMEVPISVPADHEAEWNDIVRLVRAAIAQLPPRTREAYVLHRQHELTYADVARIMGTSAKTAEHQVASALRSLRMMLAQLRP
jgi:RNA polymerase sigma-70 factor (ECF subfamily)